MKTMYLMRHGQTLFNQLGKIQGACDSPLTTLGIEQAQAARQYFEAQNITFDTVVSSTQERAIDTAKIVAPDQPIQYYKGLKEWNFGVFEGESERLNPKLSAQRTSYGDFFVPYGGEDADEVQARMCATLESILDQTPNTVLAVSHGGAMYRFIQKNVPDTIVSTLAFSNCCILEFTYEDHVFTFQNIIHPTQLKS